MPCDSIPDPDSTGLAVLKLPLPKSLQDSLPETGFPLLLEVDIALAAASDGKGTVVLTKIHSKRPVKLVEAIQGLAATPSK